MNLPELDKYNVIAVTGQMASGKNYVCSLLQEQGWKALDADILVHEAIDIARDRIMDTFEPYAKQHKITLNKKDGSIDRRALGQLLFQMPGLLKIQESIVYPIITARIQDFIKNNKKVIINATVLYKTPELLELCQVILYVKAPFLKRLSRARKRDKLPYKQIFRRFYSQKDLLKLYKNTKKEIIFINN